MGDNVQITAGSGTTVSTEEVTTLNGASVSAQHIQRMGAAAITADGVAKDLLLGRNADAASLSAALSTEDVALLSALLTQSDFDSKIGSLTETAPASDTASSGINGRLQRVAQRLTTLIGLLPTALGANGGLKVEGVASGTAVPVSGTFWQATQPVSAASLPLPTGAATAAKQPALGTAGTPSSDVITVQGITNGTALPVTPSISATSRFTSAVVNASSSGNNTLISGTVGQTIRVFAIDLMMAGAVNIKFRDGASTDLSAAQPFYAGGGKVLDPFPSGDPLFVCTAGNDFVLNLSAAVAVTGTIWYTKG